MGHSEPKESMCIPQNRQNRWHGYNATQDPRKIMQLCTTEVKQCIIVRTRHTAYCWKALTSKKTILHRFVDFSKILHSQEFKGASFGPEVVTMITMMITTIDLDLRNMRLEPLKLKRNNPASMSTTQRAARHVCQQACMPPGMDASRHVCHQACQQACMPRATRPEPAAC